MEKRFFLGAIVLAAMLFGILFLTVDEPEMENSAVSAEDNATHATVAQHVVSNAQNATVDTTSVHRVSAEMAQNVLKQDANGTTSAEDKMQQVDKIEKAPPAFGFIGDGEHLQIVGLMSDADREGALKKYLNHLCQMRQCSVDVGYQHDIIEAPWQEAIVQLLKLFDAGKVENGSLFIEANSIKIEGKVAQVKEAIEIQKIFNQLGSEGLRVENRLAMAEGIPQMKSQADAVPERNETSAPTVAVMPEKEKTSTPVQQKEVAEKSAAEKKVEKKTEPVAPEKVSKIKKQPAPKSASKPQKRIVVKKSVQKKARQHKPKKREVRKKVVRSVATEDIVAPSHMETAWDVEKKINSIGGNHQVPASGKDTIVAEPKMEVMK